MAEVAMRIDLTSRRELLVPSLPVIIAVPAAFRSLLNARVTTTQSRRSGAAAQPLPFEYWRPCFEHSCLIWYGGAAGVAAANAVHDRHQQVQAVVLH